MPLRKGSYKGPHLATRRQLLELLKTEGELSSQQMAQAVGVSPMAIRQHMQELEQAGDARSRSQAQGKGRPTKYWSLAPGAARHFPDRHRDLIVDLLRGMQAKLGEAGMEALLEERAAQQKRQYRERLAAADGLGRRVEALARARSEEGYMAESRAEPQGGFLLVESHCPIRAAAGICAGLCAKELEVFRAALGEGCEVERVEHLLSGGRRCAYRIAPKR